MACFLPQITSGTRVSYVKEVDCAPPSPTVAMKEIRRTSWEVAANIDTGVSEEISSSRQTIDRIPLGGALGGPMAFELSFAEYDSLMEGALQSAWTDITETVSDFEVTATNTFARTTGSFVTDGLIPGVWIKTSGFTNPANNGYFKVLTVAALAITVESAASATPLTVEASGSRDYKASWIKNESVKNSYYFELFLPLLTGANKHLTYNNLEVNTMDLDFASNSLITGSFGFLGQKSEAIAATIDTSGAPDAPTANELLNTTSNVKNIRLGGSLLTATFAQGLTLSTTNNMESRQAVGEFYGVGQRSGDFDLTGSITLYLESLTEYENWLNNVIRSLDFKVEDSAGNAYIFEIPSFKWTSNPITTPGRNQDVTLSGEFGAVKDSTTGVSLIINRFAA